MAETEQNVIGPRVACDACDGEAVLSYEVQEFNYGPEADGIVLSATVPVWNCVECELQIMGDGAEEIMHEAVCVYLGRLTSREIKRLRIGFGLLQQGFSELTGYGTASIKRWEAGSQVQSEAVDKHLRLVRSLGMSEVVKRTSQRPRPAFKMPLTVEVEERAAQFNLRAPFATNRAIAA